MISFGLTGIIGSGKSVVAMILEIADIPVYNADFEAKRIMSSNESVKKMLINEFGAETYKANSLNKVFLSKLIFSDKNARHAINSIVHPEVIADFKTWLTNKKNEDIKFACIESAILFEAQIDKLLDFTINVYCDEAILIKRIIDRDNISIEQALARINSQNNYADLKPKFDFEIINNGAESILLQTINILEKMQLKPN